MAKNEIIAAMPLFFTSSDDPPHVSAVPLCGRSRRDFCRTFDCGTLDCVGCCQRTTARKTPATSHGVGSWQGADQELANF